MPPLTSNSSGPVLSSKERQPAHACPASASGRRRAGVDDDGGGAALQAHVARRGHRRGGLARLALIGQHHGERLAFAGVHAVEARQLTVAHAQPAQHRQHAVDGGDQGRVRLEAAGAEALPQRQHVEQQGDQRLGVATGVAAVSQDLALQLPNEVLLGDAEPALVARDAQARLHQSDQRHEPRAPVRRVAPGSGEIAGLVLQAQHDRRIASPVRPIEQESRVRQPGDHPPAYDIRRPGVRTVAARAGKPLPHQALRQRLVLRRAGRRKVAQPAEAVEFPCPAGARRR
jgi:hypothetical protein